MRTFLGLLLVLMVSGDTEADVTGFLNQDVLLPCSCENRKLEKEWTWQKGEEDNPERVWSNRNDSTKYKGRVKTFVSENQSNCSLLLKNIKQDDQGKYKCNFHQDTFQYIYVKLHVKVPEIGGAQSHEMNSTSNPTLDPLKNSSRSYFPLIFIPVLILVLVLGFLLFHCRKGSQGQEQTKDPESLLQTNMMEKEETISSTASYF